jgi:4-hydroxybenzoate polyprenyltransferase
MQKAKTLLRLLRPKHWLKNILIFVPLVYAFHLTEIGLLLSTIRCFVAFCFVSSAVYVVNDIADAERDRLHPTKRERPIAAGAVGKETAAILSLLLFAVGFALAVFGYRDYYVAVFTALYVLLNLAYSLFLKDIVLIDCFCIAAGFVLRVYAGGAAGDSPISGWFFVTIVAVSLFMAFGKRRGEMLSVTDATATRKVLASYDSQFIDGIIFLCAGLAIVFYALWTMVSATMMIYTVPLVIFIVCRYLLIIRAKQASGDPVATILGDKGLLLAGLLFGLGSMALLYLNP